MSSRRTVQQAKYLVGEVTSRRNDQTVGELFSRRSVHNSSIRGLATPWRYFLHLSLSSVILIDSSTDSLVHVLMLSIQAVRGLPRLCAPGMYLY